MPELINAPSAAKLASSKIPQPFVIKKGLRFPTLKEVQTAFVDVTDQWDQEFALLDRLFPETYSFDGEIEMFVTRQDSTGYVGMTFPHQLESNVRTFDYGAKVDIAKMSMSPIHFKEGKTWGEREMLHLGKLAEEVQSTQILGEVAEAVAVSKKRLRTRRKQMAYSLLTQGRMVIDRSSPDNPNQLVYNIDLGITDFEIDLPHKFDAKDVDGFSLLDPVEFVNAYNRTSRFTGRKMVEWVVNSNFEDVLADNTFIRTLIDADRGVDLNERIRPPRAFYRDRALEVFKRYTKLVVTIDDTTYLDKAGQAHYWIPDGEAVVFVGSTGPLGNFKFTAHAHGGGNGQIKIGTGEFMFTQDDTKMSNPKYSIIAGFNGMPQLTGYDVHDGGYHRLKHIKFASGSLQNPELPKKIVVGPDALSVG